MSLIKWNKNNEMYPRVNSILDNLLESGDAEFFNWRNGSSLPSVNIKDEKKKYIVEVAAPGLTIRDFNIEVVNGVLTISSETKKEDKEETDNYMRHEFSYSSFSRSFWLPEEVNEEDINVTYKDGILTTIVPKVKELEKKKTPRKIAIK